MTGLVLADAAVITGGFIDSLGQFALSPWALIPLGVALLMGAGIWHLNRRSRRPARVVFDAVPDCRWCSDRMFTDTSKCACEVPCGKSYCMRAAALTMLGAEEPVIDDALPLFFARKPQAAPWPDGDTVVDGGMGAELNEMLKGDGRA